MRTSLPTTAYTTWPPVLHATPPTLFVHLLALAFGLLLAYLVAFTVAVVQTLRQISWRLRTVDRHGDQP